MSLGNSQIDDSVFKVINEVSSGYSEKISFNKHERLKIRKEIRRNAYEFFLNKKFLTLKDDRAALSLEDLSSEVICTIFYHNRRFLTPDVRAKIQPVINKIDNLAEFVGEDRDTYSSVLKFLLLVYEGRSKTTNKGIKKYLKPVWFPKLGAENDPVPSKLKRSVTVCSGSLLPEKVLSSCIDLKGLFKPTDDELFPGSRSIRTKLSKSASWHAKLEGGFSHKNNSVFGTELSQTVDEGFVTPDDYHREITPEPYNDPVNKRVDWFTWDILKDPPSKFKTWESPGGASKRVACNWHGYPEAAYKHSRFARLVKGCHLPKLGKAIVCPSLFNDIRNLLLGHESQTFVESKDSFRIRPGTYSGQGITPVEMEEMCHPFILCGMLYRKLEQFVEKNLECHETVISQVFCHTLRLYLNKYESAVINSSCFPETLLWLIDKPLIHMQFLWTLIKPENTEKSCTHILDQLYSGLWINSDEELISLTNVFLLECSHLFVDHLIRLIRTGQSSIDLTVAEYRGKSSFAFDRVPKFLRELSNVALSSSKTLKILHQDKRMNFLRTRIERKLISPVVLDFNPKESLQQHLKKYLEQKEKEKQKLAEKKAEELKSVLEDISAKKKWRMLEDLKEKCEDLKREEYNKNIESQKEKLLDEVREELHRKYLEESRVIEKELQLARWKLKRFETKEKRKQFLKEDADKLPTAPAVGLSSTGFTTVPEVEPASSFDAKMDVCVTTPPISEPVDGVANQEGSTRNSDAQLIKKKMTLSSIEWDYGGASLDRFRKEVKDVDGNPMNQYEMNRMKALEIKKKIMSTDLIPCLPFSEDEELIYPGLSLQERSEMETDLTNFGEMSQEEIKEEVRKLFDRKELKLDSVIGSYKHNISLDSIDSVMFCHSFIQEFKSYLSKEVEIANLAVLGMIKDEFIAEIGQLREYYLFGNGVWSRDLAMDLCLLIQDGKRITTQNLMRLNRSLPKNFSLTLISQQPATFDPSNPSTIDCLSLHYMAHFPTDCLIYDKFIEKYQAIFGYLSKLERCSWLLAQATLSLKNKSNFQSQQYKQIHLYRHVMNQFVTTLRSHIFNGIDDHWRQFSSDAHSALSVDTLHNLHVSFFKNIFQLCLLNKKTSKVFQYFNKLLGKMFLFCELLRCGEWSVQGSEFSHSNFRKMAHTFNSFSDIASYVCEYLKRFVDMGYDRFGYLVESLSSNDYYTKKYVSKTR